jgi:hypothetical protein
MIYDAGLDPSAAPLVVLFERDDAIAVPLLSQVRLGGFDVRAARTPVELFDILSKNPVALVLVDLGNATAGRREFWVALDAQRRGRSLQVMTFRYTAPGSIIDPDFEPGGRAIADVEVRGAQEFQRIVEGLRQRIPSRGVADPAAASMAALNGIPSPFGMAAPPSSFGGPSGPAPAPLGYHPGFVVPGDPQQAFGPPPEAYGMPAAQAAPSAFGAPAGFGAAPWPAAQAASPFAQPADANPFVIDERSSAFAQPLNANPFAAPSPAADPAYGGPAMAHPISPFAAAPAGPFGDPRFEERAAQLSAQYAQQFNLPEANLTQRGYGAPTPFEASPPHSWDAGPAPYGVPPSANNFSAFATPQRPPFEPGPAPIADAWTPPGMDGETGVVPELAYAPLGGLGRDAGADSWLGGGPMGGGPAWARADELDTATFEGRGAERRGFEAHGYESPAARMTHLATAPIPVPTPAQGNLPAISVTPTERALGNVLVEGALLSPQKLEVLRGIQAMLASVDMPLKLGELALLFKFLSPDQLLAALLVSRGYVSPQQIAGLGRVKQELAASGMDYDLEALLGMFHILPPEQLRQIRSDLGWRHG